MRAPDGTHFDKVRALVEKNKTLDLGDIVLVERDESNAPRFSRPGDDETLAVWRKQFLPGRLYTMGRLRTRGRATSPKQNVAPEVPEGGWGDD